MKLSRGGELFPAPRQSSWGLIGLLGAIVAVVAALQLWMRREPAAFVPAVQPAASKVGRPRGLFAPVSTGGAHATTQPVSSAAMQDPGFPPPGPEVLRGRVVAPDGTPIAAADLSLRGQSTTSDAAGRFEIARAAGRLRISHADYFPRQVDAGGAETMSLVLIPGVRLLGRACAAGGRAVAGAVLQFGTGEIPPQAVTGPTGEFQSPLLPATPVCVLISHPDYQPESRVFAFRGAPERWDVTLKPGEPLAIAAADEHEVEAAGAEVWLSSGGAGATVSAWRFVGRTDDLGRLISRRPPGQASSVRVSLAGYRDETADVPPRGELRLKLRPVPAWRGHAVERRTGLPVRITAMRLDARQEGQFVEAPHRGILFESLDPGQFVVGLPPQPGTYRLHVRSQESDGSVRDLQGESEPIAFDGVTAPAHAVIRLDERLELRGVVHGPNGPIVEAAVELLADAPPESIMSELDDGPERRWEVAGVKVPAPLRKLREGKSGDRGRFQFAGLSHGTHRLRARLDGFAEYLSAPFVVPWEGDFAIHLRRPARVSGALHTSGGEPQPGVPVLLIFQSDWSRLTHTDSRGRFEFRQLGPGIGFRLVVGSAQAAGVGAGRISRSLTIEEGVDVAYDLHLDEDPQRPGAPPALHAGPEPARPEFAAAREDDLVLAPSPAAAREEDGAPGPALEIAAEPTAGATDEDAGGGNGVQENPADGAGDGAGAGGGAAEAQAAPAAARLELELFDAITRRPLEGALEVEVASAGGDKVWRGSVAGGRAAVPELPRGKHRVRIRSAGLLLAERDLDVQGDTRTGLPLEEPHWVDVRLHDADGEPFRGRASVVLRSGGREILRRLQSIDAVLRLPTPGPGDYELTVEGDELFSRLRVRVFREIEAVERPRS